MGQTTDQIKDEIDNQRQELGDNLQQLEQRVRDTMDWRAQFEQKPLLGLGLAFGAGMLLSALVPGGGDDESSRGSSGATYRYQPYASYAYGSSQSDDRSRERRPAADYSDDFSERQKKQRAPEMNEISETLDNIKGALLGLGARQLRTFLAEAVPGFKDEYEQARSKRNASPDSRIDSSPGTRMTSGGGMAGMSSAGDAAPRTHETQSAYHPDLNAQTPGLDPAASRAAATTPNADAFSRGAQTPGSTPR